MDTFQLRRFFLAFVAGLFLFAGASWSNEAHAQADTSCDDPSKQCTPAQAYAACVATITWYASATGRTNPHCEPRDGANPATAQQGIYDGLFDGGSFGAHYWARLCPSGTNWDPVTHECSGECAVGEVPDPEHPGQCLNSQKCLARNVNILVDGARPWQSKCISGCQIEMQAGGSSTSSPNSPGQTIYRGRFEYNGNVCSGGVVQTPDPDGTRTDEKTKPQECFPGTNPQACVKVDGMQCASVGDGRQVCWRPGEVGTKTDGPIAQVRQPGHVQGLENMQLPNGELGNKTGNTVQTTITNNIGGSTTTIVTSTTNYTSPSGTDAGGKNAGEKGDGSGDGKEGGEGQEKGAASTNCNVPPSCSSADSIGCAMIKQSWNNHCEMQKDLLQNPDPDGNGNYGLSDQGKVFDSGSGGNDDDGWASVDKDGWAGRGSCPIALNFSVMGTTFNIDHPQLCDLLDALAALVLVVGAFHAAVILAGGNR